MKHCLFLIVFLKLVFAGAQEPLPEEFLNRMPLDSLRGYIESVMYDDFDMGFEYSKHYLKRSKKKGDELHIAEAYLLTTMSAPRKWTLQYGDSLVETSKNLDTEKFPAYAHYIKAMSLQSMDRYKEALTQVLTANDKITSNTSKYYGNLIKNGIAILAGNNSQHELAIKYYRKTLPYLKKESHANYIMTLFGLSESYLGIKRLDSAEYYIEEGFRNTNTKGRLLPYLTLSYGRLLYEQGKYIEAKNSLTNSMPGLFEVKSSPNIAIAHYWLGKIEERLGNKENSIGHYKKIDSIFSINGTIPLQLRPAWTSIINHFNKIGDTENELKYARKLIILDSTLRDEYGFISKELTENFVIPDIQLKNKTEKEGILLGKSRVTVWAISLASLLFILTISLFWFRKKQLERERNYEAVIEKLSNQDINKKPASKPISLRPELIEMIEGGLDEFKANHAFLEKDCSLQKVADRLGTNPKYLSTYINQVQKVRFTEYLNTLRIEYVLRRLERSFNDTKSDPFRLWSMVEIAKEAGFGSREYYAKAFHKYTKLNHREYLKQLEKTVKKRS